MEEQLVSYETAVLAKEKGCKCKGQGHYNNKGELCGFQYYEWADEDFGDVEAPTQSLLQKWLRDEHNEHIGLIEGLGKWSFSMRNLKKHNVPTIYHVHLNTYEEALEAGLEMTLNLI